MVRFGVDFAFGNPTGAALAAEGVTAVGRYVPYLGDGGKGLRGSEVDDYHANGIDVFLYWETIAAQHRGGFAQGKADAQVALKNLAELGCPDDVAIYLAVDFAPNASDWPLIREYQRGFMSIAGIERTGIYGNYDVIEFAKMGQLARYFCQCVAWSRGKLSEWRHIFQDVGPTVAGLHVDHLEIYGDDFGQWRANQGMTKEDIVALFGSTERDPVSGRLLSVEERYDNAKARYDEAVSTGKSLLEQVGNAMALAVSHGGGGGGVAEHKHTPGGVA
jgi:hypothetical protein